MIGQILDLLTIAKGYTDNIIDLNIDNLYGRVMSAGPAGRRATSIKAKTREAVMQFPVLMSESISQETATIVNQALEVSYSNYVRMLISQNEVMDLKDGRQKMDFIKDIHQNDYAMSGMQDPLQMSLDDLRSGNKTILDDNMPYIPAAEVNKELLIPYEENFNYKHIDGSLMESQKDKEEINKLGKELKEKDEKIESQKDANREKRFETRIVKDDVKRINELDPILLNVDILYKIDGAMHESTVTVGIKNIIHPITSAEILHYIPTSLEDERLSFRLIQWTTGEISFWKDLVLNMDRLKIDATSKKHSGWWSHLKNKSRRSASKRIFKDKSFIPNATMVFTLAEIDEIRNRNGIDLMDRDIRDVRKIMDIFFLLGFVVVDEVEGLIYNYDDTNYAWQITKIDSLSRKSKSKRREPQVLEIKLDQ